MAETRFTLDQIAVPQPPRVTITGRDLRGNEIELDYVEVTVSVPGLLTVKNQKIQAQRTIGGHTGALVHTITEEAVKPSTKKKGGRKIDVKDT